MIKYNNLLLGAFFGNKSAAGTPLLRNIFLILVRLVLTCGPDSFSSFSSLSLRAEFDNLLNSRSSDPSIEKITSRSSLSDGKSVENAFSAASDLSFGWVFFFANVFSIVFENNFPLAGLLFIFDFSSATRAAARFLRSTGVKFSVPDFLALSSISTIPTTRWTSAPSLVLPYSTVTFGAFDALKVQFSIKIYS